MIQGNDLTLSMSYNALEPHNFHKLLAKILEAVPHLPIEKV